MKNEISFKYDGGMSFKGDVNGHEMIIDADEDFGGNNRGPRPKVLLLVSLIGCTSMDVVSLFKKMRIPFTHLEVTADGNLTNEHPKYYDTIHLTYHVSGTDLDHAKVEKAVSLSQERYCGVSAMLGKAAKITYDIKYY